MPTRAPLTCADVRNAAGHTAQNCVRDRPQTVPTGRGERTWPSASGRWSPGWVGRQAASSPASRSPAASGDDAAAAIITRGPRRHTARRMCLSLLLFGLSGSSGRVGAGGGTCANRCRRAVALTAPDAASDGPRSDCRLHVSRTQVAPCCSSDWRRRDRSAWHRAREGRSQGRALRLTSGISAQSLFIKTLNIQCPDRQYKPSCDL